MAEPAVRAIPATATHDLRQRILRPFMPVSAMVYPGDDAPETVHFGAFDGTRLVAIASLYRAPHAEHAPGPDAWQFRGMASEPEVRGRGFAAAVVRAMEAHARARGGAVLWCNAREAAVPFYEKLGMRTVGERFEIERIGPHFVMIKAL